VTNKFAGMLLGSIESKENAHQVLTNIPGALLEIYNIPHILPKGKIADLIDNLEVKLCKKFI